MGLGGGHWLQMTATELYSAADEIFFFLMVQHAPILRDWIVPHATIMRNIKRNGYVIQYYNPL